MGAQLVTTMPTPSHLGGHAGRTHTDRGALLFLRDTLGVKTLLDVGCGPGGQVRLARELGITAVGVDGDASVDPDILHDFSKGPISPPNAYDCVWSVEFVEHVEERFICNTAPLFASARYVVLTHAAPGCKGHHHVNLRWSNYWVGFMAALGFSKSPLTENLRTASTMQRNFIRGSGLLFERNEQAI
jgi:hypothetical protein